MVDLRRIVVIGGGITGLSAAHAARARARAAGQDVAVTVLEASDRAGGNVVTAREAGFVLDGGPDSWIAAKPHASALARELGLEGTLVGTRPENRRYFVAWGRRLHPVPEGLVLGVPTRLLPLALSRLFTWRGKARMALEPLVPAHRFEDDEDESIASFAVRRLGKEAADRLVAPLLGGISAGDASDISLRAAFPQLAAMEREHGSLVRGMRASKRNGGHGAAGGGRAAGSAFVSLRGGVGDLVRVLAERLGRDGVVIRTGARADGLRRAPGGGWTVDVVPSGRSPSGHAADVAAGEPLHADAVLLAVPAHAAARLLRPLDSPLAEDLSSIRHASTATVFLGYRAADVRHPLSGVGFVVPRSLGRPTLAGTWVSSKWEGRAPNGHVLLRAFFGGAWGESVLERDDASLVELARAELSALMGARALGAEPVMARVFRFERATPQMRVGHVVLIRSIKARLRQVARGVLLAGGGYDGIGIPDCVRQGQTAGAELASAHAGADG